MQFCSSKKFAFAIGIYHVIHCYSSMSRVFCIWSHEDAMRMCGNYLPYILQVLTVVFTSETSPDT